MTKQLSLFASVAAATIDRLGLLIDTAMAGGALRKRLENEASDALDRKPHELPARGPWCSDYGRQTGEHVAAYRESLKQLGMELGDDGVIRLRAPDVQTPGDPAGWKASVGACR